MIVTLITQNKINTVILPDEIAGKFWLYDYISGTPVEFVSIEALNGQWVLQANSKVSINGSGANTVLKPSSIHLLNVSNNTSRYIVYSEANTSDRHEFKKYNVDRDVEISIGRSDKNDIIVSSDFISGHHANLIYKSGQWIIQDNSSTNGTFVNDNRERTKTLLEGDTIYLMGFKIITGKSCISINNPDGKVSVLLGKLKPINIREEKHSDNDDYYKRHEPFFGSWYMTKLIGKGSFGKVYEIEREDFGNVYKAALKIITIPQDEGEVKNALYEGMDTESAAEYFKSLVKEIVSEFELMSRLKGNSNIVSYEDHLVIAHEGKIGWDILIRMELLTPLMDYIKNSNFTQRDVIRLGIDMCSALELCIKRNIVHRDIKPDNIFVTEDGLFKLGDFGIARTVERTTADLSKKGTYTYMAPEVYKGEAYGLGVDIYSLGIVLYRLVNGNRAPFLPNYPEKITHTDRENALSRRMNGEKLLPPVNADIGLSHVILRATAFNPVERYISPKQMREELEAL